MNKKKTFTLLTIVLVLFSACSDNDDYLEAQVPQISSMEIVKQKGFPGDGYQALNFIPAAAKGKMTQQEYAVWKKVSSQFNLDYRFMETKYYQKNKELVLKRVLNLYDSSVKRQDLPSRLSFSWAVAEGKNKSPFENIDDSTYIDPDAPEGDSIAFKKIKIKDGTATSRYIVDYTNHYDMVFHRGYTIYAIGTSTFIEEDNFQTCDIYPNDAYFLGSWSYHISPTGTQSLYINGTYYYNLYSKPINIYYTNSL